MNLENYRRVLALPRLRPLLLLGVFCRLPGSAAPVVLTLHVVLTLDRGYGAAGLVAAVATLGMALGAPWRGRLVDRLGLRRALVSSLVIEALAWSIGPFLPYRALFVSVLIGGLFALPAFSVVRQSLAVLVPQDRRRAAFALDSIGAELTFMVGPAAGVIVATQWSSTAAMLGLGVLTVLAGAAMFVVNPPTRSATPEVPESAPVTQVTTDTDTDTATATATGVRGRTARVLRRVRPAPWVSAPLIAVLATVGGATLVLAGTDVSIVAFMREQGAVQWTAIVAVAWSASSLVGGFVYGAISRPISPFLLLGALGLLTVPVGFAPSPVTMLLTIIPAGMLCAPVLTATTEQMSRLVPERSRGEAMGWFGSASTVGLSLGAPLAGIVMDDHGPWSGFAAVGATGLVLAVIGLVVVARREEPPVDWIGGEGTATLAGDRPVQAAEMQFELQQST